MTLVVDVSTTMGLSVKEDHVLAPRDRSAVANLGHDGRKSDRGCGASLSGTDLGRALASDT